MTGDSSPGERVWTIPREDEPEFLLESLEDQAESPDSIHEQGSETALVVPCSMSGYRYDETLWPVEPSCNVVAVPTLGNQTREQYDGKAVVDGGIEHLRTEYVVTTVLVVGHTTCRVVADAYEQWVTGAAESPAGIEAQLRPLVSLVEEAVEAEILDEATPRRTAQYRLVEYNVVRQVAFLQARLPESITVVGYVHDQDGAYCSFPGKHYVVSLGDATEPTAIRSRLPDETSVRVGSILS